ncbi:MAG TPA: glycosyltransferase [Syntrophomonadaceae bacterium]|nr:glycosyltransferase [Syntrophomonadaceae bacterium]
MRNIRVLVFSATYGAGHERAAQAVIEEIGMQSPNAEITHLDCGVLLSRTFNTIIKSTYLGMIKHTPKLWGKFYYDTARISPDSKLQIILNNMGKSGIIKYINDLRPDLIICTYPTIAGVLAQLRLRHIIDVPLVTVVTDYTVHSQWIHKGVDLYIVGCRDVYRGFVDRGIDSESIRITGIPVSPRFEAEVNREEIMDRLGLIPELPTILIMGGAYGVISNPKGICQVIADMALPSQAIVVCGHNRKLYQSLEEIVENSRNPIMRFGFVNNIEELMTVSDLMVTKAGGLIVSEALTKRLPLLIFKPIPGQEEENTKFIRKMGAGIAVNSLKTLEKTVYDLLEHPDKLEKMSQAASRAWTERSAERAVNHMLQLVDSTPAKVQMG